jgi:PAS domain S-box-containing protein
MEVISDRTDVLRILPEAAAELCTALFRNSPAGIYITRDGKFIYTNIEFRHITGYSQDELSGKDYQRLVNARYRQMPKQNVASLFDEEENTNHEFKITTRDGKKKWISEKITYFKYGGNWLTLGHWMDITGHHSVETAWREAERRFQLAFEDISTGLTIIGTDGIFLKVNKAFCDMLGYDDREVLESRFDEMLPAEDRDTHGDIMSLFLSLEKPELPVQRRLLSREGRTVWAAMSISLIGDSDSGPSYFIVHFQDITEQKRLQDGIREEEWLYRSVVDLSLDPIAVADLDCRLTHVSHRLLELLGCGKADLLGREIGSLAVPDEGARMQAGVMDIVKAGQPADLSATLLKKDGSGVPARVKVSWINNEEGAPAAVVLSLQADVPVPGAQGILPEQEADAAAVEAVPVEAAVPAQPAAGEPGAPVLESDSTAIMLVNEDTIIARVNSAFEKLSGCVRDEVEGRKSWIEFVAAEDQPRLKRYYLLRRIDPETAPDTYEFKFTGVGGSADVVAFISRLPVSRQESVTLLDLAKFKRPELQEKPAEGDERYHRQLAENIRSRVWIMDLELRPLWINPHSEHQRGYTIEELKCMPLDKQMTPDCFNRAMEMYARVMQEEREGRADRTAAYSMDLELYRPDGTTFWSENVFSFIRDAAGKAVAILTEGRDIPDRKQADDSVEKSLERFHQTVHDVITAMSRIIEMRDPYTSGHQERVALLACAIACELGMDAEQLEAITITSKIHDIGKVYVPMEILSKPGALADIERQIIQAHARGSYDILKSVDFPWPVAEIALQHHERMDGSGYPDGLKGDEISLPARIIMVADVVEAMASHRPYRPSLGIGPALAEIEVNSGKLYDEQVAQACLLLFRQKGFSFDGSEAVPG